MKKQAVCAVEACLCSQDTLVRAEIKVQNYWLKTQWLCLNHAIELLKEYQPEQEAEQGKL